MRDGMMEGELYEPDVERRNGTMGSRELAPPGYVMHVACGFEAKPHPTALSNQGRDALRRVP
jgi:hypothetical protein